MCLWRRSLQGSRPSHPQSLMVHFRQSHCGLLVKPQRCLTLPWGVSTRSKVTDHQNRTLCHQIGTGRPGHTWKAKMLWYWHTSWGWQKEWTISSSSSLKFLTWQPDKRFKTCDWRDESPLKKKSFSHRCSVLKLIRICLLLWLWWLYHGCLHMSKHQTAHIKYEKFFV